MKTKRKILAWLLVASAICSFSGCELGLTSLFPSNDSSSSESGYQPSEEEKDKLVSFERGGSSDFWARNDRGNGYPFNCSFQRDNAVIEEGVLTLSLTDTGDGYAGAEYRSNEYFSYGTYSVSMKAAKCPGVISSFFTYTNDPWDEIDIEFLGDDTTRIQFNYYTNGVGGHEYIYELGFDGAEDFHEYAFDWQPGSITWYVDGKAVYTATKDIPTKSGQIMMNVWNVHEDSAAWAGKFDETQLPVCAQYQWIDYTTSLR